MPENRACKDANLKICGGSLHRLRPIHKPGNSIVRGARDAHHIAAYLLPATLTVGRSAAWKTKNATHRRLQHVVEFRLPQFDRTPGQVSQ
jgi:hypothetical protein